MIVRTNSDRADRAENCLLSEYNENDDRTNAYDFLCDLHHWADRKKLDWNQLLESADMHYQDEVFEETGDYPANDAKAPWLEEAIDQIVKTGQLVTKIITDKELYKQPDENPEKEEDENDGTN